MQRIYLFLYGLLLALFAVIIFFRPITAINEDLGRHILLGEIITKTLTVPQNNALSYTYFNSPFINTHWFPEVVYYAFAQIGGFELLLIFNTVLALLALFILIFYASKKNSIAAVFIALTIYIFLLIARTDIRPEIFSALFITLFVVCLRFFRNYQKSILVFLFCIELLWVNSHIYFFIGPALVAVYLLDECIRSKFVIDQNVKRLIVLLGVVLLATLINPNGLRGALVPFTVFQNYGFPVLENNSIFKIYFLFHQESVLFPGFVIASLLVMMVLLRKKMQRVDIMVALAFSLAALLVFRNIIPFIFATFFIYVSLVDLCIKRYSSFFKGLPKKPMLPFYPISILVLMLVIYQAYTTLSVGFGVRDHGKGAVDFILKNNIQDNLFNDFNIGGYLSYRIYPRLVYVDNRPEAYPGDFPRDVYLRMLDEPQLFEQENQKYTFRGIILTHWDKTPFENKLLAYLVNNPQYQLVYLDYYSVVIVPQSNTELVNAFGIDKEEIRLSSISDPETLVRYLFFFEKSKWKDKAKEAVSQLRKVDPHLCKLREYPILIHYDTSFITPDELKEICPQGVRRGVYSSVPMLDWMSF